jgi:putative colanic acid biosynthesis acetyltransferase WcaB
MLASRTAYRDILAADRRANSAYPKSRFVLRWFRLAQRWRTGRDPMSRAMFLLIGGSYKVVTEGFMGIELPVSTQVGPGLRLRHGVGVVINPASRIGTNVMIRQGVTLGNRRRIDDCPTIEDDVEIGVGAVIIGPISVGRGARIGPNAVVFRDVPAGAVVYSPISAVSDSDPVEA